MGAQRGESDARECAPRALGVMKRGVGARGGLPRGVLWRGVLWRGVLWWRGVRGVPGHAPSTERAGEPPAAYLSVQLWQTRTALA